MIAGQEILQHGDEITLVNHLNTDDTERMNWNLLQHSNGFIRENGALQARKIAEIPEDEAAMLRAKNDTDFLAFEMCGDKSALKRLLQRFPYWRCSSGGF